MNSDNKPNDLDDIDHLSASVEDASINAAQKQAAISAARKAFSAKKRVGAHASEKQSHVDENNFQGNEAVERPIGTFTSKKGHSMFGSLREFFAKPAVLGFGATACIAVLGGVLLFPKPLLLEKTSEQAAIDEGLAEGMAETSIVEMSEVVVTGRVASDTSASADAASAYESEVPVTTNGSNPKQLAASQPEALLESSKASIQPQQELVVSRTAAKASRTAASQAPTLRQPIQGNYPPESVRPRESQVMQQDRSRFDSQARAEFTSVAKAPVSTFSLDVDTASYSYTRSLLNRNQLPDPSHIRLEEMVNYFDYQYPLPQSQNEPFSLNYYVSPSPWSKRAHLVHIGVKGYEVPSEEVKGSNLVFLLDVSGSMSAENKLPLLKQSLALLVDGLQPSDTIGIVVYAGAAGAVLAPTKAAEKAKILDALKNLKAGGSTAGAQGLELAYQMAAQNFKKNAVNRVILATDGDFNVGVVGDDNLQKLIEKKRETGITLSVLGFGNNNYQDAMMQRLAQYGNGNAFYIDTLSEAKKVLVDEALSTLIAIAKDVKIQLEFNPERVASYRLLGYQSRMLSERDFSNDKIDAGEIGSGHTVTAIYEVELLENSLESQRRYKANKAEQVSISNSKVSDVSRELAFLRARYKLPQSDKSKLIETPVLDTKNGVGNDSDLIAREFRFAQAVAGFSLLLAGDPEVQGFSFDTVKQLANANKGSDAFGYRDEFIRLVDKAALIQRVNTMN